MKKYALIIDEEDKKRVVPSNWLTEDKHHLLWPSDKSIDIKKATVECLQTSSDWEKFKITKVIKYNDNYVTACEEMKTSRLEEVSDPSDQEKLKKSRSKRTAKVDEDFVSSATIAKKKKNENVNTLKKCRKQIINSDSEEASSDEENSNFLNAMLPSTCNVIEQSTASNSYTNGVEASAKVPVSADASDLSQLTNAQMLHKILGNQEKMCKQMHAVEIRQELLEKNFNSLKQQALKKMEVSSLSEDEMKIINKYFPVNNDPENPDKKMDVVNAKLKKKKFAEMLCYKTRWNYLMLNQIKIERLKGLGGSSTRDATYKMMSFVAKDEVYIKYSFKGQKTNESGKNKSFRDTLLCTCIYHAVKKVVNPATDDEIKLAMQKWLDQAKTRFTGKQGTSKEICFKTLDLLIDADDSE